MQSILPILSAALGIVAAAAVFALALARRHRHAPTASIWQCSESVPGGVEAERSRAK